MPCNLLIICSCIFLSPASDVQKHLCVFPAKIVTTCPGSPFCLLIHFFLQLKHDLHIQRCSYHLNSRGHLYLDERGFRCHSLCYFSSTTPLCCKLLFVMMLFQFKIIVVTHWFVTQIVSPFTVCYRLFFVIYLPVATMSRTFKENRAEIEMPNVLQWNVFMCPKTAVVLLYI